MVDLLIYVAIGVIVLVLLWWIISQVPLPPPLGQILNIVLVVVAALFIIGILLHFGGHASFVWR